MSIIITADKEEYQHMTVHVLIRLWFGVYAKFSKQYK